MSDTVLTALIAAGVPAIVTIVSAILQHRSKKLTDAMKENCAHMDERFNEVDKKIVEGQRKDELAITRVELMMLMAHNPENVLEIERLARKYFDPNWLNGNSYMTGIVSRWSKEHGIDPNAIIRGLN